MMLWSYNLLHILFLMSIYIYKYMYLCLYLLEVSRSAQGSVTESSVSNIQRYPYVTEFMVKITFKFTKKQHFIACLQ